VSQAIGYPNFSLTQTISKPTRPKAAPKRPFFVFLTRRKLRAASLKKCCAVWRAGARAPGRLAPERFALFFCLTQVARGFAQEALCLVEGRRSPCVAWLRHDGAGSPCSRALRAVFSLSASCRATGAVAGDQASAQSARRPMKPRQLSISEMAIHSSAVWAWAMSPGPQTTDGKPAAWKRPASVA
jgi:hypothetical protein